MSEPEALDSALLKRFPLPEHPDDADKDERGLALFVAGSRELAGAALLAGTSALRAGAGRLRVAAPESIAPRLSIAMPEARVIPFGEDEEGSLDHEGVEKLAKVCAKVDSLTIGPGMVAGDALADLIRSILESEGDYPLVLDAAALSVLAPLAGRMRSWASGAILLPHAGEMARLLEREVEVIQADPLAAAQEAAQRFRAVTVIKGEYSHIVAPDGCAFRFLGGGIGLATSGSGDTLAGIVGGLAARGADPLTAALWGVWLHGEAGRELAREVGRIGFLAREIPGRVPRLLESV